MLKKYYISLITLLSVAVLAVIFTQAYWIRNAYLSELRSIEQAALTAVNESAICLSWYENEVRNYELSHEPYMAQHNIIATEHTDEVTDSLQRADWFLELRKRVVKKYMPRSIDHSLIKRKIERNYIAFVIYGQDTISAIDTESNDTLFNWRTNTFELPNPETGLTFNQYLFDSEELPSKWILSIYLITPISHYLTATKGTLILSILFSLIILSIFLISIKLIIRNQQLATDRDEMITNLTHELKTPISTIYLAASQISQTQPDKIQQFSEIIKKEDKRILKHVEAVLNLTRSEEKGIELNLKPVLITDIIQSVVEVFQPHISARNGTLNLIQQTTDVVIQADQEKLSLAFLNLIDNAFKYCTRSPEINIRLFKENNQLLIEIRDNGIGIASAHLKRIFDKYYRVPMQNNHLAGGYGIGLTFTRNIIEQHGGSISVNSVPNIGSCFTIKLLNA